MSELEKARAGFVLSLLAFSLIVVLWGRAEPANVPAAQAAIAVCAATKGALCEPVGLGSKIQLNAGVEYEREAAQLGAMTVVAQRLPTQLGEMLVLAPRYAPDSDTRVRLAKAHSGIGRQVIVAQ